MRSTDTPVDFPMDDSFNESLSNNGTTDDNGAISENCDASMVDSFNDFPFNNEDADGAAQSENIDTGHEDSVADDPIGGKGEDDTIESTVIPIDSVETAKGEGKRRSSRNISKRAKYTETTEDSDGVEPSMKKLKLNSVGDKERRSFDKGSSHSKQVKKGIQVSTKEKNELMCPECEYRTRSVHTWISHLRFKHSTTPVMAGCILRCERGHESYSYKHSTECDISNFTVICKGNGAIRRITDDVVTPQCILCENYPKTPLGYALHLKIHHKTTLTKNGIFLVCSCGCNFTYTDAHKKHDKKCTGREFTLHKLD